MDSSVDSPSSSSTDDDTRRNPNIDSTSSHGSSPDSIQISLDAVEHQLSSIVENFDCSSKYHTETDRRPLISDNISEFSLNAENFDCSSKSHTETDRRALISDNIREFSLNVENFDCSSKSHTETDRGALISDNIKEFSLNAVENQLSSISVVENCDCSSKSHIETDRGALISDNIREFSLNAVENQLSSISIVENCDCSSKSHAGALISDNIREFSRDCTLTGDDLTARNGGDVEVDGRCSPSSSGYAGERGSCVGTSVFETVGEGEITGFGEGVTGMKTFWSSEKRHRTEDDTSISWRKRKKHFFILSNSGKPIYSRYGDEHKLAGFTATLQAIISFVEDGGDNIKLVRAGKHQVVFVVKGPVYLVCISCTEEPHEWLQEQLEFVYGQMILILTKAVNRCFEKNPKFDMTPLLGGTNFIFSSLIHSFGWNPATFLHAYTCLHLPYSTRKAAASVLQDVTDSGVLFAILMNKHKVVSLVGAQKASLHPDDILLLSNFVVSSESFRTSESFTPVCLPRYNPMAFLYAYVHYFDGVTYLLLLTTSSNAFYHLKECRRGIEMVLVKSNVLSEIQRFMADGGMRVEDLPLSSPRSRNILPHLDPNITTVADSPRTSKVTSSSVGGPCGLWHFIYRSVFLDQYVSSEFSSPITTPRQQKRLHRAYQKLIVSMHDKEVGPHKTQFRRDEHYVLLCWVTRDFELYAAFDPLADKASSIKVCNLICQWVKDMENEVFLLGASPFSW